MKKFFAFLILFTIKINSKEVTVNVTYHESSYISWIEHLEIKIDDCKTVEKLKNKIRKAIDKNFCSSFISPISGIELSYDSNELQNNQIISDIMQKYNLDNELNLDAEILYE